jgi:hypothetical protein
MLENDSMATKSKLKAHLFLDEFGEAPIFKIQVTSVPETLLLLLVQLIPASSPFHPSFEAA